MPTHGAVLYAKEVARIVAFYANVAGLRAAKRADEFVALERGEFQLVVLRIPERLAKTIGLATPPERRENVPVKLVFFVENLARARELAAEHGGELNPPHREWTFEGATVCDGMDPEGNVFQLRQVQG